jgi:hypothetical protein
MLDKERKYFEDHLQEWLAPVVNVMNVASASYASTS